ncbi:hypothetical protein [Bacillus litorisediminis]|uniref:hypothetical protein n=1 Tax=Bacillus litorisediminis TaxID=2922713 RepID=UPI001FAF2C91|nr:hypothetical protein [Bacillus litorisediminis]
MEITKKDLFFCYDVQLCRYLRSKGFYYLLSAISNANQRFWLYAQSRELREAIDEYKTNKN